MSLPPERRAEYALGDFDRVDAIQQPGTYLLVPDPYQERVLNSGIYGFHNFVDKPTPSWAPLFRDIKKNVGPIDFQYFKREPSYSQKSSQLTDRIPYGSFLGIPHIGFIHAADQVVSYRFSSNTRHGYDSWKLNMRDIQCVSDYMGQLVIEYSREHRGAVSIEIHGTDPDSEKFIDAWKGSAILEGENPGDIIQSVIQSFNAELQLQRAPIWLKR